MIRKEDVHNTIFEFHRFCAKCGGFKLKTRFRQHEFSRKRSKVCMECEQAFGIDGYDYKKDVKKGEENE